MTVYVPDTGMKSSTTESIAAQPDDILRHLSLRDHRGRIGYLPGLQDATDVGAIDIDFKAFRDGSAFNAAVLAVTSTMDVHGIHWYREGSTNGGAHIWVFLSEPLPYAQVRTFLKILTANAGMPKLETFPKGNNAESSWIYLPYAGANVHPENLGLTYLQDHSGKPIPLWALAERIERTPMHAVFSAVAKQTQAAEKATDKAPTSDLDSEKFPQLTAANLTPPDSFSRHESIEAFLNLAERMGKQAEMAEHLKSEAVYDIWVKDGSRPLEA